MQLGRILTSDTQGGLYISYNDGKAPEEEEIVEMPRDDGFLSTFLNRYVSARRHADEKNLIVASNFAKTYTFDEVDVTQVVKDLLKSDRSGDQSENEDSSGFVSIKSQENSSNEGNGDSVQTEAK